MLHIAHGPKVESLAVDRSDRVAIVVKTDGSLRNDTGTPEHATGPLPPLLPKAADGQQKLKSKLPAQ